VHYQPSPWRPAVGTPRPPTPPQQDPPAPVAAVAVFPIVVGTVPDSCRPAVEPPAAPKAPAVAVAAPRDEPPPPPPGGALLRRTSAAASVAPTFISVTDTASKSASSLAPSPALSGARVLDRILALSRSIGRAHDFVGHSAFLLFALLYKRRPFVWEGDRRIDLIDTYAPWAAEVCTQRCLVEAVTCCLQPAEAGHAIMRPVSEEHPLHMCRHWLAVTPLSEPFPEPGDSIRSFYSRCGLALLGSVVNGDCGPDVMCQMLGENLTGENFLRVRTELSEYLLARWRTHWMHNLLVACAEIDQDDLNCYRSTQDAAPPPPAVPPAAPGPATPPPFVDAINLDDLDLPDDDTIVGPPTPPPPDLPELAGPPTPRGTRDSEAAVAVAEQDEIEFREALAWATSSTDDVLLLSLRRSLPEAVLDEQVRAYRARSAAPEPPASSPLLPRSPLHS